MKQKWPSIKLVGLCPCCGVEFGKPKIKFNLVKRVLEWQYECPCTAEYKGVVPQTKESIIEISLS